MKRLVLVMLGCVVGGGLLVSACSSGSTGSPANLIGTQDMVFVDELQAGNMVADEPSTVGPPDRGVPSRFLFITSPDTNELRVLETYHPPLLGRIFVQAPNPLETLSIPVLDRPSLLTADEGLDPALRRVTGAYVYAGRTGGGQLSVVNAAASGFNQVTRSPLPLPGPLTAFAGWMGHDVVTVPDVTHLYFATWNGTTSALYDYPFPTTRVPADIIAAKPKLIADFGGEVVSVIKVAPPFAGRTLDGQPFCSGTSECLVVATRTNQGKVGRTIMLEPSTLRVATLGFPTAVREVVVKPDVTVGEDGTSALKGWVGWAILSEEECTATVCGGVIAVDLGAALSSTGFAVVKDFTGQTMLPITLGAPLPRGLTIAHGAIGTGVEQFPAIRELGLHDAADAGLYGTLADDAGTRVQPTLQQYAQIGFFSNANGEIVPFDATTRVSVDYDGRRPALVAATLRVPGVIDDGGFGFFYDDGGTSFGQFDGGISSVTATGAAPDILNDLIYTWTVSTPTDTDLPFTITVADGFLLSQTFTVAHQGVIPGFAQLATSGTSPALSFTPGLEYRVATGDRVLFGQPTDDGGIGPCGETTVTGIDAGLLVVAQVPSTCANPTSYTVRATGSDPVVVSGDVEGFLARTRVGATVTYNRRYLAAPVPAPLSLPDGGIQTALTMTIGDIGDNNPVPGSYWAFTFVGHLQPMRMSFDPSLVPCTPYVPGKVVATRLPQNSNTVATLYAWDLMTLVPAGNAVIELPFVNTDDNGFLNLSQNVSCYR